MIKYLSLIFVAASLFSAPIRADDLSAYKIVPADWICSPPPKTNYLWGGSITNFSWLVVTNDCSGLLSCTNTTPQAHWVYVGERTNSFSGISAGSETIVYHSNLVIEVQCGGTNRMAVLDSTEPSVLRRNFHYQRVYEE